jgi:hypothetical protein
VGWQKEEDGGQERPEGSSVVVALGLGARNSIESVTIILTQLDLCSCALTHILADQGNDRTDSRTNSNTPVSRKICLKNRNLCSARRFLHLTSPWLLATIHLVAPFLSLFTSLRDKAQVFIKQNQNNIVLTPNPACAF